MFLIRNIIFGLSLHPTPTVIATGRNCRGESGGCTSTLVLHLAEDILFEYVGKHQVNWNRVCGAMRDLPWLNIWSSDDPVEVLNEHLSLLVGRYVPTKIIRVRNKDKTSFADQCRRAFDLKQEAHLRWTRDCSRVNWEEFVRCQVRANEAYSEAKHQFSVRNIEVLMNVQSPHKWWSTLKSAVFSLGSSLPPLVGPGGALVCELVGKADLLSDHFDSKQSRQSVICWSLAIRILV